jgi:hypothetical protein
MATVQHARTNEELVAELQELLSELVHRLDNYKEACRAGSENSRSAADEGLVLAARSHRLLSWAMSETYHVQCKLEEFGWAPTDA